MLQTRRGKRTGKAATRIAIDLVNEGVVSRKEALMRVSPEQLEQLLHPVVDPAAKTTALATGLPASPGAAAGKVIFNADEAKALGEAGEKVILVRHETNPDDFHGMVAAQAIVTAWCGCWQSALNIQSCRCWPVQIGPFPPVALSVPLGISNKCDRLPLSNGAVQVSAQWCLTGAGPALTICRWLWV
jgi:pyruvate,orthophosphate dikinase